MTMKPRARNHGRPGRLTALTLKLDAGLGEAPLTSYELKVARRLRLSKRMVPEAVHVEAAASSTMEDDTNTSLFTPGCAAYAGYYNGSFANMTAVRAYAASQHARSFSYTPNADPGADAIDIEPGDASPADASGFYAAGGRYFYASASTTQQVINNLSVNGHARSSYKIISAHYTGVAHICAPTVCGFPAADATQWTDLYLGRSLDATLFNAAFFGTPPPPPNKATQPTKVSVTARWTNATISWSGATKVTQYKVDLVDAVSGTHLDTVLLPPSANSFTFRHLKTLHKYTLGIYAQHGAAGTQSQWANVTTR